MARYYVAGIPFDDEKCLKHSGVKGMKWYQHLFGPDANTKYINWMNDIGKFANNAAKGVGSAVTNAAKTVGSAVNKGANFVTGNQARQNLNAAKNANPADTNYQAKVNRYQDQYNQTLPGMAGQAAQNATNWVNQAGDNVRNGNVANAVGNAANQAREVVGGFFDRVGDWGRGAVNDVGNAVTNAGNAAGDWAGQAARDVGGAVTNAGNAVGDWVNQAGDNVRNGNVANAIADVYNSSPVLGGLDRAVLGAAQNAGNWIGDRAHDVGDWAGQAARDAGNAVGNFVDSNITGNTQRQNAEMYNRTAQNPNADSVARAMNQIAANNAQANADATLFGRVGNAANAVGDWAGQAAQNVGGAVTNAGNAVGDWVNQAGDNVRNGNVANAVSGAAGDALNFLTGNRSREELMRAIQQDYSFPNAQARYDYGIQALQNLQNTLPSIAGRAVNSVGDWVGQAARNVGGAVTDAGNAVGDWTGQAVQKVGNWIDDRFLNHSALDDKPEGVTDAFWSNYVASGGTREQYERDWK